MIYIQLNGGLGNQMFQYACGKSLAQKNETELYLYTKLLNKKKIIGGNTARTFELDIFNINEFDISYIKKSTIFFKRIINAMSYKFGLDRVQSSKYFVERQFSFNKNISIIVNECFISGYWQSPLYFSQIESIIKEDFQFPTLKNSNNIDLAKKIKESNAVSIHIRRGDLLNSKAHVTHGTCSINYYNKAISYVSKKITNPVFFVFSDDIAWVKLNLKFEAKRYYVSGNNNKNSYVDMQLMSRCKHNIIANSSFSWWGAWLNSNPGKIVISPRQWFKNKIMNEQTNDLIPAKWIRL